MKKLYVTAVTIIGLMAAAWLRTYAAPRVQISVTPSVDAVFTSTRQITSIAAAGGEVWATTLGGVLQRDKEGKWQKFTRLQGLPSQEARLVSLANDGTPHVSLPNSKVQWKNEQWQKIDGKVPLTNTAQPATATWNGRLVEAGWNGLRIRNGDKWQDIKLPPSKGTHISALLPRAGGLWAAMFGDGLWEYSGAGWKPLQIGLPAQAREITALAEDAVTGSLWIGTRRDGLWEYSGGNWTQYLQPDEPYEHNGQAMVNFKGELFLSTLEDGLSVRTEQGWQQLGDTTLSSNAPRQMVEFQGALYVRHGGGKIDRFDGKTWKRDVFPWLPRKKAMAIASDGNRLFVAQWGGWSEWDGKAWSHVLRVPELQGLPLMSLQPDDDTLWIGTQSRGIAEVTQTIEASKTDGVKATTQAAPTLTPTLPEVSYKVRWHDERHGLPDDWITCLFKTDNAIYAGTFIGGLTYSNGERWQHLKELEGENVTALEPDGNSGLYIATRNGIWHKSGAGVLRRLNDSLSFLDTEAQALCKVPHGLWIATRTGLYFVTNQSLQLQSGQVAQRENS